MAAKKTTILLCDDIRQETGNKMSLMGVYGPDIFCSEMPMMLHRLCVVIFINKLFKKINHLYVTIKLPGKKDDIAIDLLENSSLPAKKGDDAVVNLVLNSVKILEKGAGKIELRNAKSEKPFEVYKINFKLASQKVQAP